MTFIKMYRISAAITAWIGLALFFYVTVEHKSGTELIDGIITYFSYFTILSNIMVALAFTFSCTPPRTRIGRFLSRPDVRSAIAIYIIVTGVVYLILLSNLSPPGQIRRVANILLHYVVPVMYVFDWLFFVPKGTLAWKQVLSWLVFPILYAALTLIRGTQTESYPYFFLNVTQLGYPRVLLNCVFLLAVFTLLGLLLVAIDRWMGKSPRLRGSGSGHRS